MRGMRRRMAKSCSGSSSASTSCPTARCACSSRKARDQSKASFHASSRIACGTSSGSNGRSAASAAATRSGHAGSQLGQPRKHRVLRERRRRGRAGTGAAAAGLPAEDRAACSGAWAPRHVDGSQDRGERGRILNLGFVHCHRAAHQPVLEHGQVGRVHAAGDPHADRRRARAPPAESASPPAADPSNSSR